MPIIILIIGLILGFISANYVNNNAFAVSATTVDRGTLVQLYDAAFGRPLDSGADFHIGRELKTVLSDINNSAERRYYSALFKAVKAYEEAIRAPGELSVEDKARYLEAIDSALATLIAWVETLPERPICDGVIRPEEAREAITAAYEGMTLVAKQNAEFGVFNSLNRIGAPDTLKLPVFRCTLPPPTPVPTCTARPACLDSTPSCMLPEPIGGWCPTPLPL